MLELKKGEEILAVVGGITTIVDAKKIFANNLDARSTIRNWP